MSTPPSAASGLTPARLAPDARRLAEDVAYYLSQTPRQLPSQYLYDDLGSALFEAICRLPWYRIARIEEQLLQQHAGHILQRHGTPSSLVELGPGSGSKLAALLDSSPPRRRLPVHLVDVSAAALDASARAIEAHHVAIATHLAEYETGLAEAMEGSEGQALVLFLGSNIGNFDPPGAEAFLRAVRAAVGAGGRLLLGTDLVKPEPELRLAYDDPLGVTAAFNRNLLVRINRELGANFDVDGFAHEVRWDAGTARVEMHLVSRRRQDVQIPAAGLEITLEDGEAIWTESSYKYKADDVAIMLARAGFGTLDQWSGNRYALTLAEVVVRDERRGTE